MWMIDNIYKYTNSHKLIYFPCCLVLVCGSFDIYIYIYLTYILHFKGNNDITVQLQMRKMEEFVAYLNNSFFIWLYDHIFIQRSLRFRRFVYHLPFSKSKHLTHVHIPLI